MAEPCVLRSTKVGNGFVKEDVIAYIGELDSRMKELYSDLMRVGISCDVRMPFELVSNLRATKIGNGFIKEDVLACLDEINSSMEKMSSLLNESNKRNAVAQKNDVQSSSDGIISYINEQNLKIKNLEQENSILKQRISAYENKIAEYENRLSAITSFISGQIK